MITMNLTRPTTTPNRELATAIETLVRHELADRFGVRLADQDTFDLTEDGDLLRVTATGDVDRLPTSARHFGLIAAAIYLRDPEGC